LAKRALEGAAKAAAEVAVEGAAAGQRTVIGKLKDLTKPSLGGEHAAEALAGSR